MEWEDGYKKGIMLVSEVYIRFSSEQLEYFKFCCGFLIFRVLGKNLGEMNDMKTSMKKKTLEINIWSRT